MVGREGANKGQGNNGTRKAGAEGKWPHTPQCTHNSTQQTTRTTHKAASKNQKVKEPQGGMGPKQHGHGTWHVCTMVSQQEYMASQ